MSNTLRCYFVKTSLKTLRFKQQRLKARFQNYYWIVLQLAHKINSRVRVSYVFFSCSVLSV